MAITTTDQRSPGAPKIERYSIAGGINSNAGDQESAPIPLKFLLLKNCLVDKRYPGVLLKRPGSRTETISGTPHGIPMGINEHITGSADSLIPVLRTIITSFAGTQWYQNRSNTWSALTVDSDTSFATTKPYSFTQLGSMLYIAGGRPAYWEGYNKAVRRLGIVPPTTRVIYNDSYAFSPGLQVDLGTRYIVTYFDSTTGRESDWSEPSELITTAAVESKIIIDLPSADTATNWDQKKIYRYLDGGEFPYLVATVTSATTQYHDTTPDAQLTTPASRRYDKALPPEQSFICANYAECLWLVDAADPFRLVFSKPFTGSDADPSYFPAANYVRTREAITGLLVTSNKMLVFHPRSISIITGGSVDEFDLKPLIPGIGTVFAQSIATNGTDIVFLSEQGFVSIVFGGGNKVHLSREIDLDLQPLLVNAYNSSFYATTVWNPSLRQFIFILSARSTAFAGWVEVGTGLPGLWEDSVSLTTETWDDISNPSAQDIMRVKVWGWSPELSASAENLWMEYTFPYAADNNVNGDQFTCAFHPSSSSDLNDPQQDKTYVGVLNPTTGSIISMFRRDMTLDDATTITSEWLTRRLYPGNQDGGYKMYQRLGFENSYSDPTSDGLCTLKYLKDFDDGELRSYTGQLISMESIARDEKRFPQSLAKHIHIHGTDTSTSQSKILLSEFFIKFRERFRKGSR